MNGPVSSPWPVVSPGERRAARFLLVVVGVPFAGVIFAAGLDRLQLFTAEGRPFLALFVVCFAAVAVSARSGRKP
jgi:hypothetical protein